VGVGRSQTSGDVIDHVLGQFSQDETSVLDDILQKATEAIATILSKGTMEGMNRYNQSLR
jgi:PTH1 family peptidyl-tRNA hydrolase